MTSWHSHFWWQATRAAGRRPPTLALTPLEVVSPSETALFPHHSSNFRVVWSQRRNEWNDDFSQQCFLCQGTGVIVLACPYWVVKLVWEAAILPLREHNNGPVIYPKAADCVLGLWALKLHPLPIHWLPLCIFLSQKIELCGRTLQKGKKMQGSFGTTKPSHATIIFQQIMWERPPARNTVCHLSSRTRAWMQNQLTGLTCCTFSARAEPPWISRSRQRQWLPRWLQNLTQGKKEHQKNWEWQCTSYRNSIFHRLIIYLATARVTWVTGGVTKTLGVPSQIFWVLFL